MTRPSVRAASSLAIVALMAAALAGCSSWPSHSPNEAGIPEARADALAQIEELESALTFTDRVVILGTGQEDSCNAAHNQWFDNNDPGYRCWMSHTVVAVIPDAQTAQEVAAAVDTEFEVLDVPYPPGSAVRSYMAGYPRDREPGSYMRFVTGGDAGRVTLAVEVEQFRVDTWPPPSIHASTTGNVSGTGDASEITADDVRATGATATLEITLSTEYWNTLGLPEMLPGPPAEHSSWEQTSYGNEHVVEIADWSPAGEPFATCLTDPAIDQATITRTEEPYTYLRLTLLPTAVDDDLTRIGLCISPTLTGGTLVTYDPYE